MKSHNKNVLCLVNDADMLRFVYVDKTVAEEMTAGRSTAFNSSGCHLKAGRRLTLKSPLPQRLSAPYLRPSFDDYDDD